MLKFEEFSAKQHVSTILHIDMNAFFASCEQRRHPELVGKPVIVGEDERRSVVSAASYEARKFGIHSAMPIFEAKKLCPNAIFMQVDMPYYREISDLVFSIISDYTYMVEPVGIDEAFLDVRYALKMFKSPQKIAHSIIQRVENEVGIKCCVGIGKSKSIAKLASSMAKPSAKDGSHISFANFNVIPQDGVLEISPDNTINFLKEQSVAKLFGVGPKMVQKLQGYGIYTIAQLWEVPKESLQKILGDTMCEKIIRLSTGSDDNYVKFEYSPPKSLSNELTFKVDTRNIDDLSKRLNHLANKVANRLDEINLNAKTVGITLKTADFEGYTKSKTLLRGTNSGFQIYQNTLKLLKKWLETDSRKLRLLGVHTSNFDSVNTIYL